MKWLSAGLTFVNVATVLALLLGMMAGGLGRGIALASFLFGSLAAALAYFTTNDTRLDVKPENPPAASAPEFDFHRIGFWALAGCFAFFAFRAFCWLLYIDGNQLKIQSVNNLGDLSLHITYIRTFANGVALWPDNPIFVFSKLRYPAGTDIFNALSLLLGMEITRGLVWAGLLGSLATFYALYRWAGLFGIAGFLFNGGFFQLFQSLKLRDFPGDKVIAWKSIALTMFITQRGLLYALPAGLLLLYHWRAKYFSRPNENKDQRETRLTLPFWVELTLYASMPLFHIHTFIALSVVAAFFFLIGDKAMRKHFAVLVGGAFLPATFFVWLITDHFQARSLMRFHWGWVQTPPGDFAAPFLGFWLLNFGVLGPLVLALIAVCIWRACKSEGRFDFKTNPSLAFLAPAAFLFLFACTVKSAPWEWDNIKIIIWAYLIILPILWTELIARWPEPARSITCVALFISGSMALFNGLADKNGYGIGDRVEIDAVGAALRKLPVEARFAAYPTYNHPLLLQGRKLVLGYPGHLWTQGFDYTDPMMRLEKLMRGTPDWREQARYLRARYLFWGREEKTNYATSTRAWEREARLVVSGQWGAIYDLETSPGAAGPTRQ